MEFRKLKSRPSSDFKKPATSATRGALTQRALTAGVSTESEITESGTPTPTFPEEVKLLLKQAGMILLHGEEWVSGREPGENTWSVCFAARK